MRLMNTGTKPCRTSHHLLEQNAALNAPHKHQCRDLRHINTSGQQVYRNHNARISLVLEMVDCLLDLLLITAANASGNLHDGVIINTRF